MNVSDEIRFESSPHEVFELIIDQNKHQEFSKNYVSIEREIGGKCNWYNSMFGEILDLEQDKRIVHTWRANDWPEGEKAMVIFEFKDIPEGTLLQFSLKDIPDVSPYNQVDWKKGWETAYWNPMKEWLEKNKK